jgi:hypothetical protein
MRHPVDTSQPWIPTGERSSLRMHTAATESVSLCEPRKRCDSHKPHRKLKLDMMRAFFQSFTPKVFVASPWANGEST